MEYEGNSLGATARADVYVPGKPDTPYLARVSDIADQTRIIGDCVQEFIDRCRGGRGDSAKPGGPTPVPSCHFGQIDRLVENMTRLDKLARELQTIG